MLALPFHYTAIQTAIANLLVSSAMIISSSACILAGFERGEKRRVLLVFASNLPDYTKYYSLDCISSNEPGLQHYVNNTAAHKKRIRSRAVRRVNYHFSAHKVLQAHLILFERINLKSIPIADPMDGNIAGDFCVRPLLLIG